MKTENIILGILLVLVAGALIYSVFGFGVFATATNSGQELSSQNVVTPSSAMKSIVTGSTAMGDVSVELTPHEPIDGVFKVDYASNTHSVDLSSVDLLEATTLIINGKEIKPLSAPTLRGHHNRGTISFSLEQLPETFTIKIVGIPNVE